MSNHSFIDSARMSEPDAVFGSWDYNNEQNRPGPLLPLNFAVHGGVTRNEIAPQVNIKSSMVVSVP